MYIRLYSNSSRPRKVTSCKANPEILCGEVKNFKCNKRTSFFGFKYEKEKESEIEDTDTAWHINVWLDNSTLAEILTVGKTYWVHDKIDDEPIEYKIETTQDLKELRAYILSHIKD